MAAMTGTCPWSTCWHALPLWATGESSSYGRPTPYLSVPQWSLVSLRHEKYKQNDGAEDALSVKRPRKSQAQASPHTPSAVVHYTLAPSGCLHVPNPSPLPRVWAPKPKPQYPVPTQRSQPADKCLRVVSVGCTDTLCRSLSLLCLLHTCFCALL